MDKSECIALWESRKIEIEITGNCMNGNPHSPQKYFDSPKSQYTKDEMIEYCDRMIKKLSSHPFPKPRSEDQD